MKNNKNTPDFKKALLILNGEQLKPDWISVFWDNIPARYACDGSVNFLGKYGFFPNFIMGDFDSISSENQKHFSDEQKILLKDQDFTDAEKSIQFLIKQGFQEIHVIGYHGGRADHFLHNLGLLKTYSESLDTLFFWKSDELLQMVHKKISFKDCVKKRISFFGASSQGKIKKTEGLQYNLEDFDFELWSSTSISNQIISPNASIELSTGKILVVLEVDKNQIQTILTKGKGFFL